MTNYVLAKKLQKDVAHLDMCPLLIESFKKYISFFCTQFGQTYT